jgi:hypothetical protein
MAGRIAAMLAAGLVLLTLAAALREWRRKPDPLKPRPVERSVEARPETGGRCAIHRARFGGRRAHLVKVMKGGVPNYVVLEVGKRDPLLRLQRVDWLRAVYGGAEQTWLGEYGSAESALMRAARLCPAALRCWPGEPGCGPQAEPVEPARAFLNH